MKIIFLSLLIVCAGLVAKGQIYTEEARSGFPGSNLPAVDTEKVWFLVVDTAEMPTGWVSLADGLHRGYRVSYMIPGWIAEEKRGDQWNETFWMAAVAYLDEFKHPLSKNFMIWDSRPRK